MDRTSGPAVTFNASSTYFTTSNLAIALLITLILCPLLTWTCSKAQAWPVRPGGEKEPPVASYWIPWIQHLFSFLRDPNGLFQTLGFVFSIEKAVRTNMFLRQKYHGTPFTILMMSTKFHVFSSATAVATVFSKSREFQFPPVVASMMENGVDLPVPDRRFFNIPLSGEKHPGTDQEEHDFVRQNHTIYLKYLTSSRLDDIMAVYTDNFYSELDRALDIDNFGEEWKEIKLHETMRKVVFQTSTTTFFGHRIRKYWGENMWSDFRTWNDATYIGVRANFAYYFQPKAYFARKRMLQAFDKWVDCDIEDWPEENGAWNEKWGCRMNWEREKLARQSGFTHRGRACSQASFLFVEVYKKSGP
jgi:hypothetical protein